MESCLVRRGGKSFSELEVVTQATVQKSRG